MIVHNNYFEQYCIYMYRGCCSVTVEGVHGKAPKWYLIDSKILLAKCFPFHSMNKENLTRNQESLKAFFFTHPFSCIFPNLLKSWWLHWIFLHFHHSNDPLFSTWVKSQPLLGGGVSDILCCLGFLCNLGWLCCCYSRSDFFFQCFPSFSCCLYIETEVFLNYYL